MAKLRAKLNRYVSPVSVPVPVLTRIKIIIIKMLPNAKAIRGHTPTHTHT